MIEKIKKITSRKDSNKRNVEKKNYSFRATTGKDSKLIVKSNGVSKEFPVSIHDDISTKVKEAYQD